MPYVEVFRQAGQEAQGHYAAIGETDLVVDDEPSIRMLVTDLLEEARFTAIEAKEGVAAMKVLETGTRIDLLITDVGLPNGMNGRQVGDAARAMRPGLKVLFITGVPRMPSWVTATWTRAWRS